jgi:exopolysaccharide biosynthesis polyprenyl glycosylphosphotransferase
VETAFDTVRSQTAGLLVRPWKRTPASWLRLRPARVWLLACLAVDATMLALAVGATALGAKAAGVGFPPIGWVLAYAVLCLVLFRSRGLYAPRLHLRSLDDLKSVLLATTVAAMAVLTARVLLGDTDNLTSDTLRLWAFAAAYTWVGRVALYWSVQRARALGETARPTLIVGAGKVGCQVAQRLLDRPELGLRPVAFLDKDPLNDTNEAVGLPIAGASWDFDEVVERYGIEQVVITFSTAPDEVLLRIVRRAEELGVNVALVPRLFERMPEKYRLEHLGGVPLITPRPADPKAWQFRVKYLIDRVVAGAALLVLSPLFLGVSLAVLLTMGRPIFFRQIRIGRDGRSFGMLKFRSMRQARATDSTPAAQVERPEGLGPGGVEGADRRTLLGSILRKTSLDELPQLVNVVRGEMSIVGPRPERPEFVSEFEQTVYRYGDRHRVKSGITGWAQVHGLRGRTSLSDRAEWDNYYIENFSLWLDMKIALMTVGTVFGSYAAVE